MDLAFPCADIEYQSDCRKFAKHSRGNFACASEFNKNHCQGCALKTLKGAQCSKLGNPGCPAYDFYTKISTCIPCHIRQYTGHHTKNKGRTPDCSLGTSRHCKSTFLIIHVAHSWIKSDGASPGKVYNLVTRKVRVPRVALATCKVRWPIYTCI